MTALFQLPLQAKDSYSTATTALTKAAQEALEARGLDLELIAKLGWSSLSENTNGEAIAIPFYVDGKQVATKYRTITGQKKFWQSDGGAKVLYNHDAIADWQKGESPLLICEGEMDCAIALQCGYLAVSVPDGAPAKILDIGTVKYSYLDDFPVKGEVIICADGDEAGANLLHDIGQRIGKHRCKWVKYPQGCKDLNDAFMKYGERGVHETIARASWLKVDGVYKMSELPPLPPSEGVELDVIPIKIRRGDFSVVTGIPSHGKSTLTNYLSFIMAKKGWNIAAASFEQTPQTQHRYSLRTLACGMLAHLAKPDEIAHADKWIDQHFSFIVPDDDKDEEANLGWLLEKMAAAVVRHKIDIFIIDPFNEMEHDYDPRAMTETKYVSFAIRQFKKFARRYRVHVMVIAHPTKLQRDKEGKYPVPTPYDIEGSAHWYNKPDLAMVVHLKADSTTMVRVAKSRYHDDIGKPDDYLLSFDPKTKKYSKVNEIYSMYGGADA